jgi:hypothetical protein
MARSSRKEGDSEDSTFSPLFDHIARRYSTTTTAVYGVVWRHCRMRDGVCRATTTRMGKLIGMNRTTVLRHIEILVKDGYLVDLTPDRRNRPHVYQLVRTAYPRPGSSLDNRDLGE